MRIEFAEEGKKSLHELHIGIQQRIKGELKKLLGKPKLGKELVEDLAGFYSLIVGKYRAIYAIEEDRIIIYLVGHRRDVYDRFRNR